jgi:hypothetical protein
VDVGDQDWLCTAAGMRYCVDTIQLNKLAVFGAEPMQTRKLKELNRGSHVWGWSKSVDLLTYVSRDR